MVVARIAVEIWVAPEDISLFCPVYAGLIFELNATVRLDLRAGQHALKKEK
jgi:hypothetical protein